MKWQRTVVYEWEADTLEDALEAWDDGGPEVSPPVVAVDFSNIEEAA